jgi:hypothetical protein
MVPIRHGSDTTRVPIRRGVSHFSHLLRKVGEAKPARELFTTRIPTPSAKRSLSSIPWPVPPGLDRAGTNLTHCNGQIGAGSSNITLYIVWPYEQAPQVAHTLQQMPILRVRKGRGRKNRESTIMVARQDQKIQPYVGTAAPGCPVEQSSTPLHQTIPVMLSEAGRTEGPPCAVEASL